MRFSKHVFANVLDGINRNKIRTYIKLGDPSTDVQCKFPNSNIGGIWSIGELGNKKQITSM